MIRRDGLTIEGGYSQSRCTPSRVSLMTGRYPFNIGFQSRVSVFCNFSQNQSDPCIERSRG